MTKDKPKIHSCSYYCTRPECVLAQRDELRDRVMTVEAAVLAEKKRCRRICDAAASECSHLGDILGAQIAREIGALISAGDPA